MASLAKRAIVSGRIVLMSLDALWAYKLRSMFVIAALALGVGSLTIIVAAVDGAQRQAVEITENFGPDAAFILGGDIFNRAVGMRTLTLSWEDARRLRESLPGAYLVVPMRAKRQVPAKHRSENITVEAVIGATADYARSWNWPLVEGRDITQEDVDTASRVALVGNYVAQELFGGSPVGKSLYLQDIPFQVVGKLSTREFGGRGNINNRIIVPLTTLTQRFNMDRKYFRALRVKFHDAERMSEHAANLRSFLRHLHGLKPGEPDDFTILTADDVLKFLSMLKGSLVLFLGVTAGVSVLVGGFVLANLFYLSVTERTREIGLKKALGARPWAIMAQFLSEAMILTLVGAVLGLGLGLGLSDILARLEVIKIFISWKLFGLALGAAVVIALVFGLKPARKAARLDPIEAMKG
jgi:putative ABC transport system permease protein